MNICCQIKKITSHHHLVMMAFCFMLMQQKTNAQQEWNYTQYLFNLYDINSAYAGNHNAASFALRYRSQWIGLEGAPITQQFSAHTPLLKNKIGVGIRVQNESIGLRNQFNLKASGAYKLKLNKNTLSIGIAVGALRQNVKLNEVTAREANDVQLANLTNSTTTPLVDASVFFNANNYYVGIESSRLNRTAFSTSTNAMARLYYNLNLAGGYMIKDETDNMFQMSTLIKFSEGNIWQAEFNLLYLKENKFWFGGGYRYPASGQVMGCVNFNSQLRFGLSYDMPLSASQIQGNGSAEAFLGFNLKGTSEKSIRYF